MINAHKKRIDVHAHFVGGWILAAGNVLLVAGPMLYWPNGLF